MEIENLVLGEFLYLATTRCNCRCKHCSPVVYTGKEIELTSKQMIEQYEKSTFLQNNAISVAGGEPFLKEDLDEFIVYLDKKKIPCVITTNGWFTEKIVRLANKLEDNKTIRFAISIDGPETVHDEIRQCKGIYQKALKSAQFLKKAGFDVQINMVIQKDNLQYLDEYNNIFSEIDIPIMYIPKDFVGKEEFDFTSEDIKKIFKYVQYPRGRKYLLSKGKHTIRKCHAGRNSWFIDCNGDVYTCCGGYYKDNRKNYLIGNLLDNDFDVIFNSENKRTVCESIVDNCEGCRIPCEMEREINLFGLSTAYTKDEMRVLYDELTNLSLINDFSIDLCEWHNLEQYQNCSFRWMKVPRVRVFLRSNINKNSKLLIEYLNIKPLSDNIDMVLSIYFDNELLTKVPCITGKNQIEINLEKWQEKTDLIEIDLKVNEMWRPKDFGESIDNRQLGLGIFKISIE